MDSKRQNTSGKPARLQTLWFAVLTAGFVVSIILFPDRAFQASLHGLKIWWGSVFPALLPFLILSEIMSGFGLVRAFGALLDPVMRLFRLPGEGGWAVALALAAGPPSGAAAVKNLREREQISAEQGSRVFAASHLFSPVFIVLVVGTGLLHSAQMGYMLCLSYYSSALIALVMQRFYVKMGPAGSKITPQSNRVHETLLRQMSTAMKEAREADGRSFGQMLGDSVSRSIEALLLVGGIMMIFSVAVSVLSLIGFEQTFVQTARLLAAPLGLPDSLMQSVFSGLLEIHLGGASIGSSGASAIWTAAVTAALLGWSGISSHLQALSIARRTGIQYSHFALHRFIHGCLAFVISVWCWRPLQRTVGQLQPVFARHGGASASSSFLNDFGLRSHLLLWIVMAAVLLTTLLCAAAVSILLRRRHRPL